MNPVQKLFTPARLTAFVGVATGLAAAATSLAGVFTVGSAVGNTVVAAAGVLGTAASVFKFLEGQSAWEVANVQAQNALDLQAADHAHYGNPAQTPPEPETPSAVLPDEEPIVETPEPDRLADQAPAPVVA